MTDRDTDPDLSYRQGIDAVVRLIGGRGTSWIPAIMTALATQPLRYSELLAEVNRAEERGGNIIHGRLSEKVLSNTLPRMERLGLVTKRRMQQFQPETWYELTEFAYSLLTVLRVVAEWAQANRDAVIAALQKSDDD